MERLKSKKLFLAIILFLTLINLGFVITVLLVHHQERSEHFNVQKVNERRGRLLEKELGFNQNQIQSFHAARDEFRKKTEPLKSELRQLNRDLIVEATSVKPDTAKCNRISLRIGEVHTQIKHMTYIHLINVSKIATPQQSGKMSEFFLKILNEAPSHNHHGKD